MKKNSQNKEKVEANTYEIHVDLMIAGNGGNWRMASSVSIGSDLKIYAKPNPQEEKNTLFKKGR